jgi:hypothetical protein
LAEDYERALCSGLAAAPASYTGHLEFGAETSERSNRLLVPRVRVGVHGQGRAASLWIWSGPLRLTSCTEKPPVAVGRSAGAVLMGDVFFGGRQLGSGDVVCLRWRGNWLSGPGRVQGWLAFGWVWPLASDGDGVGGREVEVE